MVECHAMNEHGEFELLLWFLCNVHKSGDLYCMNYVFPLMFIRLHMLFVSMLIGLIYAFGG